MAKRIIAVVLALAVLCGVAGTVAAASPSEVIGNVEEWVEKYVTDNTPVDAVRDFIVDKAGLSEYVCSSKLNAMTAVNAIANGFDLTHDFGEPYESGGKYYHTCMRETCGVTYQTTVSGSTAGASAYLTYSHCANGKFYYNINNGVSEVTASYYAFVNGMTMSNRSGGSRLEFVTEQNMYLLDDAYSNTYVYVVLTGVPAPMVGTYSLAYEIVNANTNTVDTGRELALATGFTDEIRGIATNRPASGMYVWGEIYSGRMLGNEKNGYKYTVNAGDDLIILTSKCNKLCFAPYLLTKTDANKNKRFSYSVVADLYVVVESPYADMYEELIPQIINVSGELVVVGDNNEINYYDNASFINQENKTVYNPTTNEYYDYNTFVYDNDNRKYTFYNSSGDVVTQITYSNESVIQTEYITIDNTTVINEYHYYYYTGDGGGEPVEPTPTEEPGCEHLYVSQITPGTCTAAGLVTYVCELCGHTYMEAIPANGHDWLLIEEIPEVNAPPDDTVCPDCGSAEYSFIVDGDSCELTCSECLFEWTTANVVTDGYSLYRCSVCGEEHKDYDGSFDDSGIFKAIGKFLADAIKWLLDKLTELVDAINGLVDGFAEYAKLAAENKSQVAEFITAIIEFIPPPIMALIWLSVVGTLCVIVFKKFFG